MAAIGQETDRLVKNRQFAEAVKALREMAQVCSASLPQVTIAAVAAYL